MFLYSLLVRAGELIMFRCNFFSHKILPIAAHEEAWCMVVSLLAMLRLISRIRISLVHLLESFHFFFSPRWHWKWRRKLPPLLKLKSKQRLWRQRKQCWKAFTARRRRRRRRSRRRTATTTRTITCHPPSYSPRYWDTEAPKAAETCREAPPTETSFTTTPSSSSPQLLR